MRAHMLLAVAVAIGAFALRAEEAVKSDDAKANDAKSGAGAEDKDERDETLYIFVLKSGERLKGSKYVDFGDVYSVKAPDGKFSTLKKDDVAKVLEPVHPPAPAEPVRRVPPAETTEAEPPKLPEKKPEPQRSPANAARNAPAGVWILKDGRKYNANQAIEAGDDWMIQTMDGRMVKFKKSDVARVEK